jgi:CheY-like chemotaxis protein
MKTGRPSGAARRSATANRMLGDVHVLVVDDQEDARELIAMVLESAGAKVTQADSVPAAMRALAAVDFGVLVSDIGMPVKDGYDLIKRVRVGAGPIQSSNIPAVAVTAFAAPADRSKALAAGFQEHLAKPFELDVLVDVVTRLASNGPPSPTSSNSPAIAR